MLGCNKSKEPAAPKERPAQTEFGLSADQAQEPLLVVGDETVTLGEFAEQIADKSPYLRARYASPERRRELLDELVKFELLAHEARAQGLDKTEEVERARKQVMIQQLMKTEFEDKVHLSDVTDEEIEAYYTAHPEEFNKPAQRRASHILIKDKGKAAQVLKQLTDHPDDDRLFRSLVTAHSEDAATKKRGGDLQFFSAVDQRVPGDPELPNAVVDAVFKLTDVGHIHPDLVESDEGYHIVRLTGMRKALARTLEQARRTIQNKLWREKRQAAIEGFIKSLRDQASIEAHWELLSQVKLDAGASGPHSAPGPGPVGSPRPKK